MRPAMRAVFYCRTPDWAGQTCTAAEDTAIAAPRWLRAYPWDAHHSAAALTTSTMK